MSLYPNEIGFVVPVILDIPCGFIVESDGKRYMVIETILDPQRDETRIRAEEVTAPPPSDTGSGSTQEPERND